MLKTAFLFHACIPATMTPATTSGIPCEPDVKDTSLREAMNSRLFKALQSEGVLLDDHDGGCVLYEKRKEVEALLGNAV